MSVSSYLIVKPDLQYKAAPNTDIGIQTELLQTQSEVVDYDRTVSLNLITVFDGERQKSTTFRPTIKISYLYENNLVGYTDYDVYKNSLVYINPEISVINGSWSGLPTYQEFEFIRTDIDNKQIPFVTKSASSYNWNIVMSYPYENDYNVPMQYFFENGTSINPWKSGDGIPFYIVLGSERGLPVVQFNCPVEHGLLEGEYVELPFTYNDVNTFQVYSLGNGTLGSDANTFNLANVGFTGTTFNTGVTGVFKRIIDVNNSGETKSRYYVRIHKIITDPHDSIITMNGFELNSFNDEGVYQFSSLTPNKIGRVSAYQSSKTYNVTLAHDLSVINQQDNNKKPLTQIFATFQYVGYMGWFNQLRRGWKFNMLPGKTNQWWSTTNNDSLETNDITGYTRTQGNQVYNFTVNLPRTSGDTMYGDWCEWNEITQTERVISPYMQKLTYYQKGFTVPTTATTNPNGYYYQVHNPITLKVFSSYLETASNNLVEDVPAWAYFSNNLQQWIWREIYTYGYIDSLERGVDYPFLNETHYPFDNLQFRLYPEGASFDITQLYPDVVVDPIIDGCE
jgi:hypothetical protein